MFGFSTTEILIVFGIVVLLFGARRLPELGRGLGEGMRSFRDAIKGGGQAEPPQVQDANDGAKIASGDQKRAA